MDYLLNVASPIAISRFCLASARSPVAKLDKPRASSNSARQGASWSSSLWQLFQSQLRILLGAIYVSALNSDHGMQSNDPSNHIILIRNGWSDELTCMPQFFVKLLLLFAVFRLR